MSLNISSNQASSIANRSLRMADNDMTSSLRKLSSGLAVERFADNVAAGAIGSRIKSQLSALKTVSTNAQQGVAVFQIAEGTLSRVYDILVRLKSLASQAGSSQLSSVERGMLNTEYAAMLSEIDRLTANTTFNGNTLVNAAQSIGSMGVFNTNAGILNIAGGGLIAGTGSQFNMDYNSTDYTFRATNGTRTYQGTLDSSLVASGASTLSSGTSVRLYRVNTTGTGATTIAGDNSYVVVTLNNTFNARATISNTDSNSASVGVNSASSTGFSTFAFKVGISGVSSNDEISLAIRGVNTLALGLSAGYSNFAATDITTQVKADAAAAAVTIAIDLVLNSRAEVGAVQNRLESAQNNIATILENLEAARASYLDVDVASEMANFTSKQILVQAGISMLAQANQVPQSLLKLFQ
ncbi:MAG: flagellin [Dongiaceae bacterium]